ncbi:zinc metallopeptidase [Arthrobacter crystallopoietes BAB-32]|uniref:Zinc metallopeptidase n=1 Tax=Arthrobacter crystallopoietes BAB-32 TaxID=1246476 RepID=N1V7F9_9MICC|nr:neutral zinc metallopeptidase [Arthrobacter crystallopoietes]EMY35934.1 zinc metallopeptidase [Arthrobacter crystallopoietes BAB-32]
MSFNQGSRLDTSQVSDRRGGMGGKIAIGGGGLILLIASLLGVPPELLQNLTGGAAAPAGQVANGQELAQECETGADANARRDCRVVATVNSLNRYWGEALPRYNMQYPPPEAVLFDGRVSTGCGSATSAVGPFYCPVDSTAYFDVGFFDQLTDQLGAAEGPLAEEYVIAHEFGHHIQNLTGALQYSQQDPQGAGSGAVRVELQADCYAGVWAGNATEQIDPATGEPFMQPLTREDLSDALSAASAVGDDRIQEASAGQVNPHTWTHGSSEQRQAWFAHGYEIGDPSRCDTFNAPDLGSPS